MRFQLTGKWCRCFMVPTSCEIPHFLDLFMGKVWIIKRTLNSYWTVRATDPKRASGSVPRFRSTEQLLQTLTKSLEEDLTDMVLWVLRWYLLVQASSPHLISPFKRLVQTNALMELRNWNWNSSIQLEESNPSSTETQPEIQGFLTTDVQLRPNTFIQFSFLGLLTINLYLIQ